ncbi:hypothetical protein BZG78_15130 [Salinivibrio sp. MA351]|uniref:hypothetical protein n=1 Tax=unclassified Salinivibrio TaxID=2636825 RepID=UPI0009890AFD|nr:MULTISPECIES: hypothetical protein [unclassified Salinivibrio]OOE95194.1 hypothetical protein BZG78_15130 [Salinivibrio sp. MA351]OOF02208.1 hypothetical protein BZG80_13045 [Salinivibrio sp. MA440]
MDKGLISPLHNLVASLVPGLPQAQSAVQLVRAYDAYRGKHRADKLAQGLELAWSCMDESDQKSFDTLCHDPHFREQAVEYIEAALNTPSEILIKAIALLMLNDPDCRLDGAQKERFVHGFTGLSDQAVSVYLSLVKTEKFTERLYDIHLVSNKYPLEDNDTSPEIILMMHQSFLNRGILLPDQANSGSFFDSGDRDPNDWFVRFGVSDEINQYRALLEKAKALG